MENYVLSSVFPSLIKCRIAHHTHCNNTKHHNNSNHMPSCDYAAAAKNFMLQYLCPMLIADCNCKHSIQKTLPESL